MEVWSIGSKNEDKKMIYIILGIVFLFSFDSAYAYGVKESPTSRFKIENFKKDIESLNIDFQEFGRIKEYGILGYYNFCPLIKDNKIISYVCLTHLKVYDRNEPFIVLISLDGRILDYCIPEAKNKHKILNSTEVKEKVIGKDKSEDLFLDAVAGSTFHVPAINMELKNILNMFEYREEIIRKDENIRESN